MEDREPEVNHPMEENPRVKQLVKKNGLRLMRMETPSQK